MSAPREAVLYARVSTDYDPRAPENQDPETQLRALREHCAARGWTPIAEHVDRASGDPARRRRRGDPEGLRLALEQLAARRGRVLVIFGADRLVRHPTALLELVGRIQAMGADIASVQDAGDLDTTTDVGELLTFLRGWFSRMYLRLLRASTRAGLARARAAGKRIGRPRTGPAGDDVVRLRAAGYSWRVIGDTLGCTASAVRRAWKRADCPDAADPSSPAGPRRAAQR